MSREHKEDTSPLLMHAARELTLSGAFDKDSVYGGMLGKSVMKLMRAFVSDGHSGNSAAITIALFTRVASWKALSEITDKPEDWNKLGADMFPKQTWQSKRQPSLFSEDGGKTYYDVEDKKRVIKKSKPHEKADKEKAV